MAVQSADSDQRYALMRARAGEMLDEVQARFSVALDGSLVIFDRNRLLLVATLAAWLWVGNMVVRRLSWLPGRMRSVAPSGLDTPAPEAGPTRLVRWRVPLVTYGRSQRQAEALIGDAVARVVQCAREVGKPIVIEQMDFRPPAGVLDRQGPCRVSFGRR